jgi:hypothetical protein
MNDLAEPLQEETAASTEPRYVRAREWERLTGLGPRTTQDLVGKGELKAIKVGKAMLIDYRYGLEWLGNRPSAQIRPQKRPPPRRRPDPAA